MSVCENSEKKYVCVVHCSGIALKTQTNWIKSSKYSVSLTTQFYCPSAS